MKYPGAAEYQEEISIIAKAKKMTWIEAFEKSPFKQLAETKAQEDSKKSPVVTPSNRMGFDTQKVQRLGKKLLSYRGNESDAQELVSEVLNL